MNGYVTIVQGNCVYLMTDKPYGDLVVGLAKENKITKIKSQNNHKYPRNYKYSSQCYFIEFIHTSFNKLLYLGEQVFYFV